MEHETQDLDNTLIGIVYDTAADPTFWPVILEGFSSVMTGDVDPSAPGPAQLSREPFSEWSLFSESATALAQRRSTDSSFSGDQTEERRLAATLTPHLKRAFELNRRLVKAEDERDLLRDLYGQMPFGILVVDETDTIQTQNKTAAEMIRISSKLYVDNERLCTSDPQLRQALRGVLQGVHRDDGSQGEHCARLDLGESSTGSGITLVIGPQRTYDLASLGRRRLRTLFLCTDQYESMLSIERLVELYGLTEREAHVARQIACGLGTQAIAARADVKVATVRDQLKTIYEKTGAHSQNRLAFMILTNPAVWHTPVAASDFVPTTYVEPGYYRESSITLSDGRTLSYAEYGDLSGFPVFLIHSIWGCRYERYPYDRLTAQLGIRLIVPERPGFGKSTYRPGYSYAQWGKDFSELNDALGIAECSVISFAAASYALGCAHVAPQRLRRVLLYCPWGPIDSLKDVLKMPPQFKFLLGLGLYMPSLARKFLQLQIRGMCRQPVRLFRQMIENYPPIDRPVLTDPRVESVLATSIYEGSSRSGEGLVDEFCKYTTPWDLPFGDITTPIDIYIGDQDLEIFVHMAHKLARLLPVARVHEVRDGGVFSLLSHWPDALKTAAAHRA